MKRTKKMHKAALDAYAEFKAGISNPLTLAIEQGQIKRNGGMKVTQLGKSNFRSLTGVERGSIYKRTSKGYAKNYNPHMSEGRTH